MAHARANAWRIPEHYDQNWQPLPDYNVDRRSDQFRPYGTTPGHSFEWARLLLTLEAGRDGAPRLAARSGDRALRYRRRRRRGSGTVTRD